MNLGPAPAHDPLELTPASSRALAGIFCKPHGSIFCSPSRENCSALSPFLSCKLGFHSHKVNVSSTCALGTSTEAFPGIQVVSSSHQVISGTSVAASNRAAVVHRRKPRRRRPAFSNLLSPFPSYSLSLLCRSAAGETPAKDLISAFTCSQTSLERGSRRGLSAKRRRLAISNAMGVGEAAAPAFSLGMVVFAGAITLVLLPLTLFLAGLIFQPRWIIRLVRRRIPHVVFEHVTKERVVALTIDDAPSGDSTHDLLDILRDNDCHATFFIIGSNMDTSPGLVERMWKEGHEVGNHTMHDAPSWRLSPEEFESQLLQVDGKLSKFYRKDEDGPMKWFRPGHGWYTKRMLRVLAKHGYRMALGSVFPYDPLFRHKGRPIAQYLLWKAYPGAIIVLHDRKPQQHQTVEILRRLLPKLKSRGYSVVTLSELMKQ